MDPYPIDDFSSLRTFHSSVYLSSIILRLYKYNVRITRALVETPDLRRRACLPSCCGGSTKRNQIRRYSQEIGNEYNICDQDTESSTYPWLHSDSQETWLEVRYYISFSIVKLWFDITVQPEQDFKGTSIFMKANGSINEQLIETLCNRVIDFVQQ